MELREQEAPLREEHGREIEPARQAGTLALEARDPLRVPDLAQADDWQALITCDGVPFAYFDLGGPGRVRDPALIEATLGRERERARAMVELAAGLHRRLGSPSPRRVELRCSVVVCTHRRPELLAQALASIARLDPAPFEVVVVDNDPGEHDCRREAEAAGARYVREERRGLDLARVAGLRAARGELVAFTDDDCVVPSGWLRMLPERFADPTVAAVTGPAFPFELETVHQLHREAVAPFPQAVALHRFDWTNVWAVHSGRFGAGASMVLRREALEGAGEVFPPELDAGTRTRAGGDLYALYKLLAAGHRVFYDPASYVFHRHGRDLAALETTVEGYGIGLSSFLTRALVIDREPATFAVWRWLLTAFLDSLGDLLAGEGDRTVLRLRRRFLLSGFRGAVAWPLARREARSAPGGLPLGDVPPMLRAVAGPTAPRTDSVAPAQAGAAARTGSGVSLLVACRREGAEPGRCLAALRREAAAVDAELIVSGPQSAIRAPAAAAGARPVPARAGAAAVNAGVAAARGRVVVLLDADSVPAPGFLAAHLPHHEPGRAEAVVIGHSAEHPPGKRLAALATELESEDRWGLSREAAARTFVELELANVSAPRALLERIGELDPAYGARAPIEWGARALEAGVEVRLEAGAEAPVVVPTGTRAYIERALSEGTADALLAAARPSLADPLVPRLQSPTRARRAGERLVLGALRGARRRALAIAALRVLEALRLRRSWHRLANVTRRAAHEEGFRTHWTGRRRPRVATATLAVELDSDQPIPAPRVVAPEVAFTLRGRPLVTVRPPRGIWHRSLLDPAIDLVHPDVARSLLPAPGPGPAAEPRLGPASPHLEVIFGPGHHRGDDRHRTALEAAGARVRVLRAERGKAAYWRAVAEAVRRSEAEVVAIVLPGARPSPLWLESVRTAFGGERVAAAVGAGLPGDLPAGPILLRTAASERVPLQLAGAPPQFLAVKRDAYERLGGLDPGAAAAGSYGPLLEFTDRAMRAGRVVAYCEMPGLEPHWGVPGNARFARLRRARARGGLIVLRAAEMGGARGLAWFLGAGLLGGARMAWRPVSSPRLSPRAWIAGSPAYLGGMLFAAIRLAGRRRV